MANTSGFATLGHVLGGGVDREGAFQQARYRSAQTEEALASAHAKQQEAIKAERINQATQAISENAPDFRAPTDRNLADMLVGGLGAGYSSITEGLLHAQQEHQHTVAADPNTDALTRTRALGSISGKPYSDIEPVGKFGTTNITEDHPQVTASLADELTNASKNYEYSKKLPPAEQSKFAPFVRADQIVNAGGVPTAIPVAGDRTPKAVVDVNTVAGNAGAIAGGKTEGVGQAKRTLDLPTAKVRVAATDQKLNSLSDLAKQLQGDENLWKAVGPGQAISMIPGTDGARIRAQLNTLKSKVGFAVLQDMRDSSKTGGALGNISNQENKYLQNALSALDANLSPKDFRDQLQVLIDYVDGSRQRVHQAFMETYPELAQEKPAAGAPPAGGPPPAAVAPQDPSKLPPTNAKGWTLHHDKDGNYAYVSPDKSQVEEVK